MAKTTEKNGQLTPANGERRTRRKSEKPRRDTGLNALPVLQDEDSESLLKRALFYYGLSTLETDEKKKRHYLAQARNRLQRAEVTINNTLTSIKRKIEV